VITTFTPGGAGGDGGEVPFESSVQLLKSNTDYKKPIVQESILRISVSAENFSHKFLS
jgi:hypothetical protein